MQDRGLEGAQRRENAWAPGARSGAYAAADAASACFVKTPLPLLLLALTK